MHDFLYLNPAFGAVATPLRQRRIGGFQPQEETASPEEIKAARKHFYDMGWSYRSAAPQLGVSYQHLCQVLNGERQSRRLIAAVLELPQR